MSYKTQFQVEKKNHSTDEKSFDIFNFKGIQVVHSFLNIKDGLL